ncbi:BnaAnng06300D [Brassica napus]|uniref:BnaAnng06300D protein n=1 Tax=Brassica napus TaxID=3708 RepID=A0A078HSF9_BRANA|nr:BnaAnng06300D [Brassica napus]
MSGNEYGERIHNFFGQEGLSQDQHQSQVVDGSWSGFSNGLVGNQRHIDTSIINNLESCNTQQQPVDPERWQSSNSHQGLNFTQQQQPIRAEYSRSLLQDNQQLTNGYMNWMAMQNGSNVSGVGVESSRDNLSAKGFTSDIQKTPMRFEMGGESPVNYDFFGGQQQLNSQPPPGILQPFPRQQMTFNDMQLLKQQVMAKQMHEYQLQQQLHKKQLQARQLNSLNSNAVNGNRSSDNQSHLLVNGIPLQDASSNGWQPDLVSGNTNWMHRGISPFVQGSSSGLGAEHGQANLQFEPSLYGMPLGEANAPQSSFSPVQMNRLASEHGSSLTNQPDSFMLPRSTYQERAMFSNSSAPGSNDSPNFECFQQDDPHDRNVSAQEKLDQMKGSGPPEKSYIKAPGNVSGSQKSTALDPTEEKILFGSDDNLWEAFGNDTDMSLTGNLMSSSSDLNDACPSLKGGGWSALMLSAVAETSSNDAGFGNRVQNLGVKASNALRYFGQSKSLGQPPMNMQIDRGLVSQGMGSENSPSTSASADRSVDMCNQVQSASRQTMLELLHKVNQPEERSVETDAFKIPESTPSAENGGQFRHSQSSASQGFSLQLAPPSQPAPSPDNVQFSMNSLQPLNSLHTAPEKGATSQSRFAPWASSQSFPQQSTYQGPGESNNTSGFPYSKGYHQNQLPPVSTRQLTPNHLVRSSSELSTPQVKERDRSSDYSAQTPSLLNPTTHNNKGDSAEGFPMLSDSGAGTSAPQHRFWNQPPKPQPDILRPHPVTNSHVEDIFSRQEKRNQLSSQNGGDMSLSGRDMVNMHELQGQDMGAKQTAGVASMFSKMGQINHQTLDRSLPSNNRPKDDVRHNERMAGSGEGDAPKMTVKRVEDSSVHLQKVASKEVQQSPLRSDGLLRDGLNHKESENHSLPFGQTVSQSFSNKNHSASAGADHQQQISPQMAPSWYNQYGTFTPLKIGEKSSNVGSSADGSHNVQSPKQFNTQKMPGSAPGAEIPSSESLPRGATDELMNVVKPKKRKTATSELLSWNKEVMHGSQRLKTLSEAEVDWARATNQFAEKVEYGNLLEDGPRLRSKRRLIYTTQLMQQLFRPPPARVISLIASSNYEFVAYTAARGALGDTCSSTFTDRNECLLPQNKSNPVSERRKTETTSDQYISKAAEDFISRSQKLENNFAGLQNGSTIADLIVEVQDLEKFAVINRFAKFHPTSSSTDRNVSSLRLNPQRYVTIAPMPQNVPDRVHCLSL